ncbi:MAG: dipeptidyl peptidase 3 [Bacteroidetes bacterium]|nr:dipeptidyl peptidase 3 [Bacteroidota bacterium]
MKFTILTFLICATFFTLSCNKDNMTQTEPFQYQTEQFADIKILRYQVPGFEELSQERKLLLYYLYEAALSGRDIMYDQNCRYNLSVRKTLEEIINGYSGDKGSESWSQFLVYAKRVWFSNGIHHHYSSSKFFPECDRDYFKSLIAQTPEGKFPFHGGESLADFSERISEIIYNPAVAPKKTNKDSKTDIIKTSSNNFYEGVTQQETEDFYNRLIDRNDTTPISYGLNSKLIKEAGIIKERLYRSGEMYSSAIDRIIFWLEKAEPVAENENQKEVISKLIKFYKTGSLAMFDEYNIAWVRDTQSLVDFVNGFIETYNDPMGMRGSFESMVSFKNLEASKRIEAISNEAQWFEDNSTIPDKYKKAKVTGIQARVITVVVESGDAAPSTPIGVNLPNANWIRKQHGSKSVNLGNIVDAYDEAGKTSGMLEEFCSGPEEINLAKTHGTLGNNLHTDLHEVIGHASGQIKEGVGTPRETLKNYASTIEEARADLVALYFIMDPKLVSLGVMPSTDVGKTEYNSFIRNGLMTQLVRLTPGENIEEDHMRNRQLIALWAYENGLKDQVIEKKVLNGKTYFVINDYEKLRALFGKLLNEMQRITSEGDYAAAQNLVETFGVKVDTVIHKEVLERYSRLNIAPYAGFIQPKLVPVYDGETIRDVKIEYPSDFKTQMLDYARDYSFLPVLN